MPPVNIKWGVFRRITDVHICFNSEAFRFDLVVLSISKQASIALVHMKLDENIYVRSSYEFIFLLKIRVPQSFAFLNSFDIFCYLCNLWKVLLCCPIKKIENLFFSQETSRSYHTEIL